MPLVFRNNTISIYQVTTAGTEFTESTIFKCHSAASEAFELSLSSCLRV